MTKRGHEKLRIARKLWIHIRINMLGKAYFSINYCIGGYSKWNMALSGFLRSFLYISYNSR